MYLYKIELKSKMKGFFLQILAIGILSLVVILIYHYAAICHGPHDAGSPDCGICQRKGQSFPWKDLVLRPHLNLWVNFVVASCVVLFLFFSCFQLLFFSLFSLFHFYYFFIYFFSKLDYIFLLFKNIYFFLDCFPSFFYLLLFY